MLVLDLIFKLNAVEFLAGDEIHHAGDRVRAIDRRCAVG
jgi:hypothetical protein